jgi:hypothetical protein
MITELQRLVCARYGVAPVELQDDLKAGVAANVRGQLQPVNGLRHPPEGDTTGWYIWAGEELSTAPDFFVPLHVRHLADWRPEIMKFLALPPGWRFLVAGDYEDVWFDESLLNI